jgi:uncharacterized coiled-coil protein SlyX
MKNILVYVLSIILLAGCEYHKEELAQDAKTRDSLMSIVSSKDAVINDFLGSFNEIENNLMAVTQKQNQVSSDASAAGSDIKKPTKEKINEQINAINELMEKNKKKIAELQGKLKNSNGKMAELEKMIATLNDQMAQKNKELEGLNQQIASLNTTVEKLHTDVGDLTTQNTAKAKTIDDQTKAMHTAYYTVGNSKDLILKKVINKEGGFLGLGKQPILRSDFNADAFTTIDITQTTTIPVNSKEVKMVTSHPADSYKLDKDKDKVTNLFITNADKFWKASKYLVLQTK